MYHIEWRISSFELLWMLSLHKVKNKTQLFLSQLLWSQFKNRTANWKVFCWFWNNLVRIADLSIWVWTPVMFGTVSERVPLNSVQFLVFGNRAGLWRPYFILTDFDWAIIPGDHWINGLFQTFNTQRIEKIHQTVTFC